MNFKVFFSFILIFLTHCSLYGMGVSDHIPTATPTATVPDLVDQQQRIADHQRIEDHQRLVNVMFGREEMSREEQEALVRKILGRDDKGD